MITASKYDLAERVLFLDNSAIDNSNGKPIQRFLPFSVIRIEGKDYTEIHPELFANNPSDIYPASGLHSTGMPSRFTDIQIADLNNSVSYNPSAFAPTFEKHPGA